LTEIVNSDDANIVSGIGR